jgi:hypothetical protein
MDSAPTLRCVTWCNLAPCGSLRHHAAGVSDCAAADSTGSLLGLYRPMYKTVQVPPDNGVAYPEIG